MTDYEIIGRIVSGVGAGLIAALLSLLTLNIAWVVFKTIVGIPRILKSMRLLRDSERGEQE